MTSLVEKLQAARKRLSDDLAAVEAQIADLQPETIAPVPARDFAAESSDPLRWLISGLIAEGSVGMCTAHGGIGKTTLLTQLGLCVADGRPVLGLDVPAPARVLYVMAEGSRAAFRQRWLTTRRNLDIPPDVDWHIQPESFRDFLLGHPQIDSLISQCRPKLVVLDTLGYFHAGDENKATDWKQGVMAPLRYLCGRYGCTVILVHHHGKASPDRQGWQSGRGTSAMYGDVDFWLRLEPVDGDGNELKRELWIDKNKYGPMGYRRKLTFCPDLAIFRSDS